jgi:DNA-directed RNA polymerase specialized sigma24 family protein
LQAVEVLKETTCEIVNTGGSKSRKKEWVLTRAAFDKMLACLSPSREQAASKYEILRRKLMKYFECRGCHSPEDLADETVNRVARRILEGSEIWTVEPANYFYGVARHVLKEYRAELERGFTTIESLPSLVHPSLRQQELELERYSLEQRLDCLEYCLQQLSHENRQLIISYYQGEKGERIKNRRLLAERFRIPPNALRIRIHRIREKLERQVAERFQSLQSV